MYPHFYIGAVELSTFPLSLAVGFLCALLHLYVQHRLQWQRFVMSYFIFMAVIVAGFLSGHLTYRILDVVESLLSQGNNFPDFVPPGDFIFGFLWAAPATVWAMAKLLKWKNWLKAMDSFILPLLLFQIAGKVGCFLHGCCAGTHSDLPWAVPLASSIPAAHHGYVHPVQLYECLLLIAVFAGLQLYENRGQNKSGYLTLLYYIGYSLERFIVDFVRADYSTIAGTPLKISQVISLCILILAPVVMLRRRKKYRMAVARAAQKTGSSSFHLFG